MNGKNLSYLVATAAVVLVLMAGAAYVYSQPGGDDKSGFDGEWVPVIQEKAQVSDRFTCEDLGIDGLRPITITTLTLNF